MFGKWIDTAMHGAMADDEREARAHQSSAKLQMTGRAVRETDAAILFSFNNEQIWFPKSHAQLVGTDENGDHVLVISRWIAEQKGIV